MNYRQIFARKNARKQQIKQLCPDIEDKAGIYMFYRWSEEKQKWCCYIGQSQTSVWERCASHLDGYKTKNASHIDKSLFTHKLATQKKDGWQLKILTYCMPEYCNGLEQEYIAQYRKLDAIVYNVTIGSQGKGKVDFQERSQEKLKRYKNGKSKGKIATLRQIKVYFDKYLDFVIKGKETKIKARKLQEFKELLDEADNRK